MALRNHFASHLHLLALATAFAILLTACGSSAAPANGGGSVAGSTCTPGNVVITGISTEVFCGQAVGKATIDGQTYTITSGMCFNQMGMVGVNIGHEVLDATSAAGTALKAQYHYFGANVQATKDGTYANSDLAGNYGNVDFTALGTATLSNNLQAGSFTGTTIIGNKPVTGSWTC